MKYIVAAFLAITAFTVQANDPSTLDGEIVIQESPCKGTPESQKVEVHTTQGQSIELVCHHMLPQLK
jgi:hypothetical protein